MLKRVEHSLRGQTGDDFSIVYVSTEDLQADFAAYFAHGGAMVPAAVSGIALKTNEVRDLRITLPNGRELLIPVRVGQHIAGQGVLVVFEYADQAIADLQNGATDSVKVEEDRLFQSLDEQIGDPPPSIDDDTDIAGPTDPVDEDPMAIGADEIDAPGPGTKYPVYSVYYDRLRDFVPIRERFRRQGLLTLPLAEEAFPVGSKVRLRVVLPGHNVFEMWAIIERRKGASTVYRVSTQGQQLARAYVHLEKINSKNRLQQEPDSPPEDPRVVRTEEEIPPEDADKMPIRRRIGRMTTEEKMNLALTGDKESRMALANDGNKAIHHYLLRNTRISLDEIAFMARLPGMNPDVLDRIAENPSFTQNLTVTKALVFNPKTPIRTAIRLLDRLPKPELQNLAKRTSGNLKLAMAARKRLDQMHSS
jgi:hypothetical protein